MSVVFCFVRFVVCYSLSAKPATAQIQTKLVLLFTSGGSCMSSLPLYVHIHCELVSCTDSLLGRGRGRVSLTARKGHGVILELEEERAKEEVITTGRRTILMRALVVLARLVAGLPSICVICFVM